MYSYRYRIYVQHKDDNEVSQYSSGSISTDLTEADQISNLIANKELRQFKSPKWKINQKKKYFTAEWLNRRGSNYLIEVRRTKN